ncbi:hypothetical protein T484DRAFT_1892405, partial [Baffinella frigidus]
MERGGGCVFPMDEGGGGGGEAARVVTVFLAALSCVLASPSSVATVFLAVVSCVLASPSSARTLVAPEEAWEALDLDLLTRDSPRNLAAIDHDTFRTRVQSKWLTSKRFSARLLA